MVKMNDMLAGAVLKNDFLLFTDGELVRIEARELLPNGTVALGLANSRAQVFPPHRALRIATVRDCPRTGMRLTRAIRAGCDDSVIWIPAPA